KADRFHGYRRGAQRGTAPAEPGIRDLEPHGGASWPPRCPEPGGGGVPLLASGAICRTQPVACAGRALAGGLSMMERAGETAYPTNANTVFGSGPIPNAGLPSD